MVVSAVHAGGRSEQVFEVHPRGGNKALIGHEATGRPIPSPFGKLTCSRPPRRDFASTLHSVQSTSELKLVKIISVIDQYSLG